MRVAEVMSVLGYKTIVAGDYMVVYDQTGSCLSALEILCYSVGGVLYAIRASHFICMYIKNSDKKRE